MNISQARTVRVFLSSTFRDFALERDLLVRKVFPELRRKCRERQVTLVDVDLRWGITKQEAQQGKVLPICLAEVDRARPYFIGFLGERYGWTPEETQYDLSLLVEQPWLEEHRGGKSVTELEILHGVLNNPKMAGRAFFYFRDPRWSKRRGGLYASEGAPEKARLEALKARIRRSGFPVVEDYPDPEALAERVREDLWRLIDEAYPADAVPDALTRERMMHEAYGATRQRLYLGGEEYFKALDQAMRAEKFSPVLITGQSGGGKSALLANWVMRWQAEHPGTAVILHHLGCVADAAEPVRLATRLMQEIARLTGEEFKPESDPEKQLEQLPQWLALGSVWAEREGRDLLLVLDGLDKVSDRKELRWFPSFLPSGVKLVTSCLEGAILQAAKGRLEWRKMEVKPFSQADQVDLIGEYLGRYRKSLTAQQTRILQGHPLSGNPLFLLTVLEELRVFGVHEELDQRLEILLSSPPGKGEGEEPTVDDVFEHVLSRLEGDIGRVYVRRAMEALWASRAGLFQYELLAIAKLTPVQWAALQNSLDESFYEGGGRISFGNDYLRKAVVDRYGLAGRNGPAVHRRLARWFALQTVDARVAEELPWQWEQAGEKKRLKALLMDPELFLTLRELDPHDLLGYLLRLGGDFHKDYQGVFKAWKLYDNKRPGALTELQKFLWDFGSTVVRDFSAMIISALDPEDLPKELAGCSFQLFAALQHGGTSRIKSPFNTDDMLGIGAWCFVLTNKIQRPEATNFQQIQVTQLHVPRYQMAAHLRQQDHFFTSESYEQGNLALWMAIPTMIHGRNKLAFMFRVHMRYTGQTMSSDFSVELPLPNWFVLKMKQDLPLLESSISEVRESESGLFHLPGLKTPAGHPVESESQNLIEAIAFEKACSPRLKAGNFGIYSAYCTHRDSEASNQMPESLIQSLVQDQCQIDPRGIGDNHHAVCVKTQLQLFGQCIWERGAMMGTREAAPVLSEGMARLTPVQRTQFLLMEGMHGAGLFLPLATIIGVCTFEDYANHVCKGLQPDSHEERDRRMEVAYIDLFGKLSSGALFG